MNSNHIAKFLCAIVAIALSDSPKAGAAAPFRLRLTTDKPGYVLGEPVALKVTIEYTGSSVLTVTHPLDHGEYSEVIEICEMGKEGCSRFLTPAEASEALRDRGGSKRQIRLQPGQLVVRTNALLCRTVIGIGLAFPTANDYFIRFRVGFNETVVQEQVQISVSEPQNQTDLDAFEWLKKSEKLCDLQYVGIEARNTNDVNVQVARLRELTEKFPTSVYAEWLNRSKQNALAAVAFPQFTNRETQVVKAIKELEAQWYDVKGFSEQSPDGGREYAERLVLLHEDLVNGRLTEADYDQHHAQLLLECVRRFAKPLNAEEWKSRSDERARLAAERERKAANDAQKRAADEERILREGRQSPK